MQSQYAALLDLAYNDTRSLGVGEMGRDSFESWSFHMY
jgi:hypothetical protein